MDRTHNKCSPERIACEEDEWKSLGEIGVVKCENGSEGHDDQGKQDLDGL